MLFNKYPQLTYKFGNKDIQVVDIFKNISFSNVDTSYAFQDYYIEDGETPESVAIKLYGSSNLSWLILLVNNFTRLQDDWFVSQLEYLGQQESKFGGNAYYIPALPNLKIGDILVRVTGTAGTAATSVDSTSYLHVADYDPYFRKIRGICGGTGSISTGDLVLIARQNPENGTVSPIYFNNQGDPSQLTNYTNILYKESYNKSVLYFYDSYSVILDPYRFSISGRTSINSNTTYLNTTDTTTENNFALCLLYRYGICGGTMPVGVLKKTVGEDEFAKYINKQKIKVLKSEHIANVLSVIESAIETDTVSKTFIIEI